MRKDNRIEKTKKLIKETFIGLVEERGYAKVTVKHITEQAQINRNTFYLHYKDKEDLINEIIMEVVNTQKEQIKEITQKFFSNPEKKIKMLIENILSIIFLEIEFYRIIITDPNLMGYIKNLEESLKTTSFEINAKNSSFDQLIVFDYIVSGIFGVLVQWVVKDPYPTENIANVLSKLVVQDYLISQ